MNKSICALVHKPGSTRAAFHAYYEESHAPLGVQHFPFTRYVRNHVIDADGPFGWDTISEFWANDIGKAAALMQGPVGETMHADEERFMDRTRIAPASAREVVLSEGAPADADGARTALLVRGAEAAVLAWAETLAAAHSGVSVDMALSWQEPAFPADAVVWVPGHPALAAAPADLAVVTLRVRRCETPAETLLGNAQPAVSG